MFESNIPIEHYIEKKIEIWKKNIEKKKGKDYNSICKTI